MELEKRPDQPPAGGGCLTTVIRIPVRIVVLVLVVPVQMVWDVLAAGGLLLRRTVLRPLGRALGWCWRTLVVGPVTGVGRGLVWLGRGVWAGARGVGAGGLWLVRYLVVVPAGWLYGQVLAPVGHGLVWMARGAGAGLGWLDRMTMVGLRWCGRVLVVAPGGWLYGRVLTPVGHGIAWAVRGVGAGLEWLGRGVWAGARGVGAGGLWLARYLVVVPAGWLYGQVLTPVGHGLVWMARGAGAGLAWLAGVIGVGLVWLGRAARTGLVGLGVAVMLPVVFVWRWVLVPVGRGIGVVAREVGDALGHAWRIAGHVSRAVGRALGGLLRWLFVNPARWVYVSVLTPVGHAVRDTVWRPVAQAARDAGRVARQVAQDAGRAARQAITAARESARETRADIRRMLFGAARETREPVRLAKPRREPGLAEARTLGSGTTALTKLTKD